MNPIHPQPVIGITMGDPLGIGPEIIAKALSSNTLQKICRPVVIGDPAVMKKALAFVEKPLPVHTIPSPDQALGTPHQIDLIPRSDLDLALIEQKTPTPVLGRATEEYILHGIDLAMDKAIHALVTAPITKTGLKLAGSKFHGHTELLAHRTQTDAFAMMLAGDRLKVVLVTIHIPLSQVPPTLTPEMIVQTLDLTRTALVRRFGIPVPRLAVAGLNPHAGESGMFGDEEERIIIPAVQTARDKGFHVDGPLPPDTVFFHAVNNAYDAVICMYHDQGLIPFKLIHFRDGVNTTLGLPIIRTSVDHGTAYDIAWQGKADPTSLVQAVRMAVLQANVSQGHPSQDRPAGED